jgi:asparagine synthetase B (glutamine-hydrolysing)
MCKIVCLTKHDPAERNNLIQAFWNDMKKTEFDGYGAAWFGANGEIGFFKSRYAYVPTEPIPDFTKSGFSEYNDIPSDGGYLIIHARAQSAGNVITLANTHPMLSDDGQTALIHNGCVYATGGKYRNISPCTCDSELLLLAYLDDGIDAVSKYISGKFAFMALQYKDDKKTLHIAKDAEKTLFTGKMPDGSYIIGTARHLFDVVGATEMGEFKDHHILIFGRQEAPELGEFEPYVYKTAAELAELDEARYANWQQHKHKNAPYVPPVPNLIAVIDDAEEILRQEREPLPA